MVLGSAEWREHSILFQYHGWSTGLLRESHKSLIILLGVNGKNESKIKLIEFRLCCLAFSCIYDIGLTTE